MRPPSKPAHAALFTRTGGGSDERHESQLVVKSSANATLGLPDPLGSGDLGIAASKAAVLHCMDCGGFTRYCAGDVAQERELNS